MILGAEFLERFTISAIRKFKPSLGISSQSRGFQGALDRAQQYRVNNSSAHTAANPIVIVSIPKWSWWALLANIFHDLRLMTELL